MVKSYVFDYFRSEVVSCQIFDHGAGDEAAGTVGSLVLVSEVLHGFGGLVDYTNFFDLHLLSKVQREFFYFADIIEF